MKAGHLGSQEEDEFIRQAKQLVENVKKTHPGVTSSSATKTPPIHSGPGSDSASATSKPPPLEETPSSTTTTKPQPPESAALVSPPPDDGKKTHPPPPDVTGLAASGKHSLGGETRPLPEVGSWLSDVGMSMSSSEDSPRPPGPASAAGEKVQEEETQGPTTITQEHAVRRT